MDSKGGPAKEFVMKTSERGGVLAGFFSVLSVLLVLSILGFLGFDLLRARAEMLSFEAGAQKGNSLILRRNEVRWTPVFSKDFVDHGDILLSPPKGYVELLQEAVRLRIDKNSLVLFESPAFHPFRKKMILRPSLISGGLWVYARSGAPYGDFDFSLLTPLKSDPEKDVRNQKRERLAGIRLREGLMTVVMDHETQSYACYLLWGRALITLRGENDQVKLKDHEVFELAEQPGGFVKRPLALTDWKNIRSGYEWAADWTAEEVSIPSGLGSLLRHARVPEAVFNRGTGFSSWRLVSGEGPDPVLEVEYDIFFPGNMAGISFPMSDFYLKSGQKISFAARALQPVSGPTQAVIEFKSGVSILMSRAIAIPAGDWETFELPVDFPFAKPVTEIAVVVRNQTNDPGARGIFRMKSFEIT